MKNLESIPVLDEEIQIDPYLEYHLDDFSSYCGECDDKKATGWRACLKCYIEYDELNN